MKLFNKIVDIALYTLAAILLITSVNSLIWNKPVLFSVVRSGSMNPVLKRGDMIILNNLSKNSNENVSSPDEVGIGDIVVFKAQTGELASQGYIVHRIVGGSLSEGYITKGDANEYTDQESGSVLIKRDWIVSKVAGNGENPVHIPLLGYPAIWMDSLRANQYILPLIILILAAVIGASQIKSGRKKNGKKSKHQSDKKYGMQLIYFLSGLIISIIMAANMITISQRITFPYEVSDKDRGIISGSSVGIIKTGDEINLPLARLKNSGFLPITAVITTKDEQLNLSHDLIRLNNGDELATLLNLKAKNPGTYEAVINIGLFYPLLPGKTIYFLANKSYWLALTVISLIPGLPLMVYPLFNKKMRRQSFRFFRRKFRRLHYKFQVT
ncbi:MAG: signal peptidase I [Saccharofermentanales bacterium]